MIKTLLKRKMKNQNQKNLTYLKGLLDLMEIIQIILIIIKKNKKEKKVIMIKIQLNTEKVTMNLKVKYKIQTIRVNKTPQNNLKSSIKKIKIVLKQKNQMKPEKIYFNMSDLWYRVVIMKTMSNKISLII